MRISMAANTQPSRHIYNYKYNIYVQIVHVYTETNGFMPCTGCRGVVSVRTWLVSSSDIFSSGPTASQPCVGLVHSSAILSCMPCFLFSCHCRKYNNWSKLVFDDDAIDITPSLLILGIDIKVHPAVLPLLSLFGRSLSLQVQIGPVEVLIEVWMTRW